MSKVLKLGISSENNKEIKEVVSIEVLVNKGVIGDSILKILMILIVNCL